MERSPSDDSPPVVTITDIHQVQCTTEGVAEKTGDELLDDIFLTSLLSRSPEKQDSESSTEKKSVEDANLDAMTSFKEPTEANPDDKQTASDESNNQNIDELIAEVSVVAENFGAMSKEGKETEASAYRSKLDSSGSSSDEDEDSTSSDTSSDSDFCQIMIESAAPKKLPLIKTKGELGMDELPLIEELVITAKEEEMALVGKIHAIVEKLVVIVALKESKPLDLDSVLFLTHGRPLGRVFDVFGPVIEPFYCVRFNSSEDITSKGIKIGADVFFVPDKVDLTSYVFVDELQKQKGSDASWKHNNEPPEEFLDFSDDEEEKAAKRKRVARSRNRQFNSPDVASKRPALKDVPSLQSNVSSRASSPDVVYSGQFPGRNPFSSRAPTQSLRSAIDPVTSTPQIVFAPPPVSFPQQQGLLQRPSSPLVFTSFPPPSFGQVALVNAPISSPMPVQVHSPFVNNFQSMIHGSQSPVAHQNYFNQRFTMNQPPPVSQAMFVAGSPQMRLNSGFPASPSRPSFVQPNRGFRGPMPVTLEAGPRPNAWHEVIRIQNPYALPPPPLHVQLPPHSALPLTVGPFQPNGAQPFVNNPDVNGHSMPPRFY